MAAKHFYRQGFLLLLFNFISTAALEKRFSDLKRCADEECSMLLCRGKAVTDFTGPDCRFLSFKKSETIYVYYKLAGRRTDMWAGSNQMFFSSVCSCLYKEIEVPSEVLKILWLTYLVMVKYSVKVLHVLSSKFYSSFSGNRFCLF
uniref:SH3 domain-containing protein n=1 Tax=Cynoglossus semilaevis TaxID=244447 RepID=A0A3P8WYC2_CYNSE